MIKKAFSVLLLGLLYLISLLPFWLLYLISDVIFLLLYHVVKYRRDVVAENLKNAFPEKSQHERDDIAQKFFKYLADLLVESIKLFTISPSEVEKRITISNKEIVTDAFANGKSVIGVLGHYGNWEMGALRFSLLFDEPRMIIYKPLNDKFFDRVFINMRSRFGATLISMRQTLRKLVEYKNERTITVMVGDQTPGGPEATYFTRFLNQPTAVFLGVEKLAKLTDSVVVFCDVRVTKRGQYHCNFVQLFTEPRQTAEHEITNAHVHYLEQVIRHMPQYWLWSHRRWKHKPEEFR